MVNLLLVLIGHTIADTEDANQKMIGNGMVAIALCASLKSALEN